MKSVMKISVIAALLAAVTALPGCTSALYSSASVGDDLYATHDRKAIAEREKREAEIAKAEAEARKAKIEAMIAEAQAKAAENSYYNLSDNSNPYQSVLADDYESAYARRLRGFESPTYRMPSSYYNYRYSDAYWYTSAYDPAFYNVIVMGDQVWVEPKYVSAMFGTWGMPSLHLSYSWGWNSWGWSWGYRPYAWDWWGWSGPHHYWPHYNRPHYGPGPGGIHGPAHKPAYRPNYRPNYRTFDNGYNNRRPVATGTNAGRTNSNYNGASYRSRNSYGNSSTSGNNSAGYRNNSGSGTRSNTGTTSSDRNRSSYSNGSSSSSSSSSSTRSNSGSSSTNRGSSYNSGSTGGGYSSGGSRGSSGGSGGGSRSR